MSVRIDFLEGMRIALHSLASYRLRTALTTLGVGLGVATLLGILGIIQGLNASFERQLASMGNASLYIAKWPWLRDENWWEYRTRKRISKRDADGLRALCKRCEAVVPILDVSHDIEYQNRKLNFVWVSASTPDWPLVSTYEVVRGRFFTTSEELEARSVVVLGSDLADTLFQRNEPLGSTIRINGRPYLVIGIFGEKGQLLDQNQDMVAVIPFSNYRAYSRGQNSIDIGVKVADPRAIPEAEDEIQGILRAIRQTPPDKPDDFTINKPDQLSSMYERLTGALYGVAMGIGFITLLVGGIGIMNIMLVSVKERTREIGIRRALGARRRTIIIQFIIEATLVSAVGGLLGTTVGLSIATIVGMVTPLTSAIQPSSIAFGIGFAAFVGLVFGIWPAARAANLDPVEALREE